MTAAAPRISVIAIGRNEGQRLIECLASLQGQVDQIVYVDSGSTDGSIAAAEAAGATVVNLDTTVPFTAARARNAGLAAARQTAPDLIQFIDGDCQLRSGWIAAAVAFLDAHPQAGVVCGRRRERFPDASVYNRLTDQEWDTPIGTAKSCGGDALMRLAALDAVGDYNPALIAGEEPELCVRIRAAGWTVHRIDAEMTWHDADITRFGQWWRRNLRAGHAYAEGAALHGAPPERHNVAQTRRALIWGAAVPILAILGAFITPWALLILLALPLQVVRLGLRSGDWTRATFLTISKVAEAIGVAKYWRGRLMNRRSTLIEYKG